MNFLDERAIREAVGFSRKAAGFTYKASFQRCDHKTRPPGVEMRCKFTKKILGHALDENIDLTGAPETLSRIKTHDRCLASS